MKTPEELVSSLERKGILKTPTIKNAFLQVDRKHFVIPEYMHLVYEDRALPIGEEQTISQPLTVAFMLELLQPEKGAKILDVGSGSGWTTALLAEIIGTSGRVYAVERIQTLKEYGEKNNAHLGYENTEFLHGNGTNGWPEKAPFDRILVNASGPAIPPALIEQLNPTGRMVIPLSDLEGNMVLVVKNNEGRISEIRRPGFAFVPLIDE